MTQDFAERVLRERTVDTRNYRYIAVEEYDVDRQWIEIRRLPISMLNTTQAIDGWETVAKIDG